MRETERRASHTVKQRKIESNDQHRAIDVFFSGEPLAVALKRSTSTH